MTKSELKNKSSKKYIPHLIAVLAMRSTAFGSLPFSLALPGRWSTVFGSFPGWLSNFYSRDQSKTTNIDDALEDTGLDDDGEWNKTNLPKAFTTLAMAFIVIGALVVTMTMIGCCGGCSKSKCCLSLNATILSFLLVFEVIAVLLMYSDESLLKTPMKKYVRKSIEKYNGFPGDTIQSFGWNYGMVQFNCCGVINYEDFEAADEWERSVTLDSVTYRLEVPITCCNPLPNSPNLTCATTTEGNNAKKGCFDTLWNKSLGNPLVAAVSYSVGFTLQILLIMFSLLLCLHEPNEVTDEFQMDDYKPRPQDWKPRLPAAKIHAITAFSTKIKPKE
ncbi:hypothetical protein FSP39_016455 [Pinctada imbricata]|uniref:Tetraspanin n=1 Tax=Pinctada imbricata TaxID=66713 RepID=A0AA88YLV7_PINIB|nr:hypothetical protein FSP39_016455 [Pinctada imbricata]